MLRPTSKPVGASNTMPRRQCARAGCNNRFKPTMNTGTHRLETACSWRLFCSKTCANYTRAERLWRKRLNVQTKGDRT